jgi:hypothetical protein
MKEIIVKTQAEVDALSKDFAGVIYVEGGSQATPLELAVAFKEAAVIVRGQAWVRLWGSSHAVLWESSHAELWESSHAVLWGSSHAVLWGEAMVSAFNSAEIVAKGYNVISVRKSDRKNMKLVVGKNSYLKVIPDFKPTFAEFAARYPVDSKGGKAILYKAVHKRDGEYLSHYDASFKYEVGKIKQQKCNPSKDNSCSQGIHVSEKSWARSFGAGWSDMALLECEVAVKDIVVAKDCDGKVRASKIKVLREVPTQELWQ